MKIFWVNLQISFKNKMPLLDDKNRELPEGAMGFFQEIGCTADNEKALRLTVNQYLSEITWLNQSSVEVSFDRVGEISPNEISSEIYDDPEIRDSLRGNPRRKGIWYTSGKAFFSDSDSDDIFEVGIQKY